MIGDCMVIICLFYLKVIFNWRIIAIQYYVGFCHTATWIGHKYRYSPSLSRLPPTWFVSFYQTAKLSFIVAVPFCICTSRPWEFLLLHILTFGGVSVSDLGHSNRYVVVSRFNLHCPYDIFVEHLLICLFVIHIFFSEVSLKVSPPSFF